MKMELLQAGLDYPLDKLSFADVMQFADFGPKLALNQPKVTDGIDPVYFLKFPVLSDKLQDPLLAPPPTIENIDDRFNGVSEDSKAVATFVMDEEEERDGVETRASENASVQLHLHESKNRKKRPRTVKTTEEVESQRMTHIAVERNRRKQMNEHLRVLRSLMPGSYVQRVRSLYSFRGCIYCILHVNLLCCSLSSCFGA